MCSAYDLVRSFLYFVLWCDVFSLWFWSVPFCDVTSFNIRFIWFLLWCDGEWLVQTLICSLFLSMSVMWGSFRIKLVFFGLFSSIQGGIYALGKAHMRSTPSRRSFLNVSFETVSTFVWLTMALSRPFKKDRLALPLSTPLSSRWSMSWCHWLCARR